MHQKRNRIRCAIEMTASFTRSIPRYQMLRLVLCSKRNTGDRVCLRTGGSVRRHEQNWARRQASNPIRHAADQITIKSRSAVR